MNKTVYFLGAGFSKDAGAPLQGDIMKLINSNFRDMRDDLRIRKAMNRFNQVIRNLNLSKRYINDYTLEDLLTPIDRCIRDNVPFRSIPAEELRLIRDSLYYLVGKTIEWGLKRPNYSSDYLEVFSEYLVRESKRRAEFRYRDKAIDPVAVISTNWDIALDNRLFTHVRNDQSVKGTVDYCCRVSSYFKDDEYVKPGLEVLGAGGYCIKVIKLHGSLNWLNCPNCQRTYVDSQDKVALREVTSCRHCRKNGIPREIMLEPNVIMPTYLKDLSSLQYKMIWHQAANELAEASRVVFMGYSLPPADFEIRQMLTRMVHSSAEIIMVTKTEIDKEKKDPEEDLNIRKAKKEKEYNVFFGRKVKAFHDGVRSYVKDHLVKG